MATTPRNRDQTTERILKAVGVLLSRSGFRALGVNAIAREAGVDKVLIYRYFGGLPKLLEAFADRGDFWPSDAELLPPGSSADPDPKALALRASRALGLLAQALRSRPETQAILVWELFERNELTDALATARERQGLRILGTLPSLPHVDVPAVAAILSAGITQLVLRARTADRYNGIDLRSDVGWARIESAGQWLVESLFEIAPPKTPAQAPPKARRANAPIAKRCERGAAPKRGAKPGRA